MNITIIGTGYVGLVTGTCFAEMGNFVTCIDIDKKKIENLNAGIVPIYEPGLEQLILQNKKARRLIFTTSFNDVVKKSNIFFITVGTPSKKNGITNMQYIYNVAENIGKYVSKQSIIINKSTVPVGTTNQINEIIANQLFNRKKDISFYVVSNPEFLKEGDAINDFMYPDRIVIGVNNKYSTKIMKKLYFPLTVKSDRLLFMGIKEAEMTKYASNSMLATKISFINEIATICDAMDIDIESVREGIGSDSRIGYSFINPGIGYGGSCFPKDIKSLIYSAKKVGINSNILKAVESRNTKQKTYLVEQINKKFNCKLKGKIFTIWGLSFKPNTDDIRGAPSINIIKYLIKAGAQIQAFDPICNKITEKQFPKSWITKNKLIFFDDHYEALQNSNAMILVTEWKMFKNLNLTKMKKNMKQCIIFDGRNQYNPKILTKNGFQYKGVGR